MKLYHRTTLEAADEIRRTRRFTSRYAVEDVWFSTHLDGYASGYGPGVVVVEVPEGIASLDDWFPGNGEEHYTIRADLIAPDMIKSC